MKNHLIFHQSAHAIFLYMDFVSNLQSLILEFFYTDIKKFNNKNTNIDFIFAEIFV
jgi:hypothetical protein